jgi:outer membrane murein-binding lipoprotein Lpp
MKNKILNLVIIVFVTGTFLTGCQSSAKKVENAEDKVQDAKEKVIDAKQDLNKVLNDSIQLFKKESEEKLIANDKSITELKEKILKEKKEHRAKDEKKLAVLEQKNNHLRKRLADYDYNEQAKNRWTSFRSEFSHDMDELGRALKGFTVKSK